MRASIIAEGDVRDGASPVFVADGDVRDGAAFFFMVARAPE
jgi:hypothetical protein